MPPIWLHSRLRFAVEKFDRPLVTNPRLLKRYRLTICLVKIPFVNSPRTPRPVPRHACRGITQPTHHRRTAARLGRTVERSDTAEGRVSKPLSQPRLQATSQPPRKLPFSNEKTSAFTFHLLTTGTRPEPRPQGRRSRRPSCRVATKNLFLHHSPLITHPSTLLPTPSHLQPSHSQKRKTTSALTLSLRRRESRVQDARRYYPRPLG